MAAFEQMNSCILSLSMEATVVHQKAHLWMTVTTTTNHPVLVERVPLVSSRFDLYAENCVTLEGAIISAMYKADALLSQLEMNRKHN